MALQSTFDFDQLLHPRTQPLPGEDEIRKLHQSAELRAMALGSFYHSMNLTEDQILEVEDELRKARMYEVLSMTSTMRRAEMDELRHRLMVRERTSREREQEKIVQHQLLRQRALEALQKEAEAAQIIGQQQLENDRRLLVQREKEKLMERRRRYEASQIASDDSYGGGQQTSQSTPRKGGGGNLSTSTPTAGKPVLVMNVALGNGKEDKITVRAHDDPKRIAILFARKHNLPEHSVSNLASQIRSNLAAITKTKEAAAQRSSLAQQQQHGLTPPGASPIIPGASPVPSATSYFR